MARRGDLGRRPRPAAVADRVDPLVIWMAYFAAGEGLAVRRLSDASGVSSSAIRHWFRGGDPPISKLRRVLNGLGYDLRLVRLGRPAPLDGRGDAIGLDLARALRRAGFHLSRSGPPGSSGPDSRVR